MPTPYRKATLFVNPPSANCHTVSIFPGYTDFRSASPVSSCPGKPARGDRQKVTKFSRRSRTNFLKKVFSLFELPGVFVTLTYPGHYPAESSEWKRHLDNFSKELLRHFPGSWFFWKLEPQKRGAPHFHLMGSLGAGNEGLSISLLRHFVAATWFRVVGSGDVRHFRAGTQVDFLKDASGKVQAYVCKYVGKSTCVSLPSWATPGRFWGIVGRKNLPAASCCHVQLTRESFYKLRRLVRRWLRRFSSSSFYADRLKSISSFFVLLPRETFFCLLGGAVGFPIFRPLEFQGVLDLESAPS